MSVAMMLSLGIIDCAVRHNTDKTRDYTNPNLPTQVPASDPQYAGTTAFFRLFVVDASARC
jgi:hypothetical protein